MTGIVTPPSRQWRFFPQHRVSVHSSLAQTIRPYHTALCVKSELCYSFSAQLYSAQSEQAPPVSLSLQLFVGELRLTVLNVAIQLWSRAVLQGCHDRINENNIGESHFIHMLLGGKGPKTLFWGKMSASQSKLVWQGFKMQPELTTELYGDLKRQVHKCQERKVLRVKQIYLCKVLL